MSLRTRILALAVGSAVAVLLLLSIPVALVSSEAAETEAESEATTLVEGVADSVSTGTTSATDLAALVERGNSRRGDDTPLTVVLADGRRLGAEQDACTRDRAQDDDRRSGRRDDSEELLPISEVGSTSVQAGTLVSIAAQDVDGGTVLVCALVRESDVRRTAGERLAALVLPAVAVLAVVAAAALLVSRRLGRHLAATADTADRLATGDLDARAPVDGPTEVRRVSAALNRLAARIEELLRTERETAADLSHRLRTPLTAVRLDVEALPDGPQRDELDEHLTTLERTLTAVIQAARRPQREGAAPSCDASEVVQDRYRYWSALLEDQDRTTSLTLALEPDHHLVRCSREDLVAALDALLENAVAHTPEGTAVDVEALSLERGWVRIDVVDRGPGVPPSALQRGRSDRGSSGLGLDIARACAEATGGGLELVREDGWSGVRLLLGPA